MTRHAKPLVLAALLALLAAAAWLLPLREWILLSLAWVDAHRGIAWAVYILAYLSAAVLLVPGSLFTLAAGFLFGLPLGVALASAGSVLGATAAFVSGRFFARAWVAERIAKLPKFRALDAAAEQDGFAIVLLARLSPLFPFNLLNYGFGITGVRLRDYCLASWIGMLPATVLYVYVGTLAKDLTELGSGQAQNGPARMALLIAGLVATAVLTMLITRRATRALGAQLERVPERKQNEP